MSQGYWSPVNNIFEYRLIIHKLSAPKHFLDELHNCQYSFVWKSSNDSYSTSTNQYTFNDKTGTIHFNKTKLKLRLNQWCSNEENEEVGEEEYTKTKLILYEKCDKQIDDDDNNANNECMTQLDEITLSTNYFLVNKRQLTNITFNKIIGNDIRIELRLNVTLIAKQNKHEEEEEVLLKWFNNMNNANNMSTGYSAGYSGYSSSVSCSDNINKNNKRRRSGLCANSVQKFYKKSKEIEEKKKEENKLIDQQIKNDYNEMGNKLMINMEESKQLKSQIAVLQNLLFERNTEFDELKQRNHKNNKKIKDLQYENNKLKSFECDYMEKLNENKILIQTMKYQLHSRYSKYNELLNIMKLKKKKQLKNYIAQLIVDNDDLEDEITRIADSWRNTSHLMENYANKKIKKYEKLKKLYKKSFTQNQYLTNKLIKHGIIQKQQQKQSDNDIQEILNNENRISDECGIEEDMNALNC